MQSSLFQTVETGARFSTDRAHRYELWRRWGPGGYVNFVMLNPSSANEVKNDPTVERQQRRVEAWGYNAIYVTNIFAFRATDPADMKKAADPIGPENDETLLRIAAGAALVICAWGNHGSFMDRAAAVRRMLSGVKLNYLRLGQTGQPCHPLYLPYGLEPTPWD